MKKTPLNTSCCYKKLFDFPNQDYDLNVVCESLVPTEVERQQNRKYAY